MILGKVIQEIEENVKYKVRVYNNKPFRDSKYKGLLELWEKTFDQQAEVQYQLNNLNADNKISQIESKIRQLESIGGLASAYKIQDKVSEINQIETSRWILREQYEEITKNQYNVENELKTSIYRSPEYFDYDCYCSAYQKQIIGAEVGVVCDGYNTSDAVILPSYFKSGYGTHLTSQELFDNWTWFFYYVMTSTLHKDYATHYKARILKRNENETFNIILNNYENVVPEMNYFNVSSTYIKESEIPYFEGDEVLIYVEKNQDGVRIPKIIGFWQEPRRAFRYSSFVFSFKQGYVLEGSEMEDYKYKLDWGSRYNTLPAIDVFSRLSGYSSINNFNDETLFVGYLLSTRSFEISGYDFDGRYFLHGTLNDFYKFDSNLSHSLYPHYYLRNFTGSPYICNEKEYKKYFFGVAGRDTRRILFNQQNRGWTNYIYKIEDGFAYLRNGKATIGANKEDCIVSVNFGDGRGHLKRQWLDPEVQNLYNDLCSHNQLIIDNDEDVNDSENPENVYLYNRITGQHFENFKDFFNSQLDTHLFFGEGGINKNETEKRISVYDLPNISGLYDAVNSRLQTPKGGRPNISDDIVFFLGNYSFNDYSSDDSQVISYKGYRCDPFRYFNFKIKDKMFIKSGTFPGQLNDVIVTNNRSRYESYGKGQSFGYVYNMTKTYNNLHDFDYRYIEYVEI
jgi:hypothetical protein